MGMSSISDRHGKRDRYTIEIRAGWKEDAIRNERRITMKKIHKSIRIDASREAVWAAIIDDGKYRLWAALFTPGSYFEGGWQPGDSIRFLAKDDQGRARGMQARIAVNEHLRRISIHHFGLTDGDSVDSDSNEAKKWTPAYENYELETLSPQATRFSVDADIPDEYLVEMAEAWDLALLKLKEVCEQNLSPFASITLTADVRAPLESVWACWNSAECVRKWNHASDDWHCPAAANDLRVGGRYVYTMAARDGSASFDFAGTYTEIVPGERITSQLDDGRMIRTVFEAVGPDRTRVVETFEADHLFPLDQQRVGWQAILDNFRKTMESDT